MRDGKGENNMCFYYVSYTCLFTVDAVALNISLLFLGITNVIRTQHSPSKSMLLLFSLSFPVNKQFCRQNLKNFKADIAYVGNIIQITAVSPT